MAHAFNTAIVEIDMRHFNLRRETIGLDRETVIVRSDFHSALLQVFHRLVSAAMPKGEFESLTAKGAAQQLVPKTNSKRRKFCAQ